jgi:hypothetical protein
VSKAENRLLAVIPDIMSDKGLDFDVIQNIPKYIDGYLNDRFGFRNESIIIINNLNYKLFKKAEINNVLFGKDGWLYYLKNEGHDTFADFNKSNILSENNLKKIYLQLESRFNWCKSNGIEFFFIIAPLKHSIYPEYYPFPRPTGESRTDQIINNMPEHLRDRIIDLRNDFLLKKDSSDTDLYYKVGVHWNYLGSFYAYNNLLKKIRGHFQDINFPGIEFNINKYEDPGEDSWLTKLHLYKFPEFKQNVVNYEPVYGWDNYYNVSMNERSIVTENKNHGLPRAIVFRDSFFNWMMPYASAGIFSSAEYFWRQFSEDYKEYILSEKPDIIVWEVFEAYLDRLLNPSWSTTELPYNYAFPEILSLETNDILSVTSDNTSLIIQCGTSDPFIILPLLEAVILSPVTASYIEIEYTNSIVGNIQVFYDYGQGFNEENSTGHRKINIHEEAAVIQFPILGQKDNSVLSAIRIDPPDGSVFKINAIRITAGDKL